MVEVSRNLGTDFGQFCQHTIYRMLYLVQVQHAHFSILWSDGQLRQFSSPEMQSSTILSIYNINHLTRDIRIKLQIHPFENRNYTWFVFIKKHTFNNE